jgi:thioredoxin reductase (NADPH)
MELMARAYNQAQKFGVEMAIPDEVIAMGDLSDLHKGGFVLKLSNGEHVSARSVVIASGARYRQPAIAGLESFEGASVHYWASPLEAKLCAGMRRAGGGLDGRRQFGGTSSGVLGEPSLQGLALGAREGPGGEHVALSRRPHRGPFHVEVLTQTTVTGLKGREGMLEAVRWRRGTSREETWRHIQHLFLFIGAEPNTDWLSGSGVALDAKGFVLTGADTSESRSPLETSRRGVFAIGDVRSGSVKRVAAAVGEGAQVVATLHAALSSPAAIRVPS